MLRKIMVHLLLLLLCLAPISASKQAWSATANLKNDLTTSQNQLLGRIVIIDEGWVSDTINASSFATITLQEHDKFRWLGNSTIIINISGANVPLLSGDEIILTKQGVYNYFEATNNTRKGSLIVEGVSKHPITISFFSSPFFTFTSSFESVVPDGDKKSNITVSVQQYTPPGKYNYSIMLSDGVFSQAINENFFVKENKSWSVEDSTKNNFTAHAGELKPLGDILVINNGNTNYTLKALITGDNSYLLDTQQSQSVLFRGTTVFNLILKAPSRQPEGLYNATLTITGGDSIFTKQYFITITDDTPPVIKRIITEETTVYKETDVVVEADDNVNVTRVEWAINGDKGNFTRDMKLWIQNYTFSTDGEHTIMVCAYDEASNKACSNKTIIVNKLDIVKARRDVTMHTIKNGRFTSNNILNLSGDSPAPINLTLQEFTADDLHNKTFFSKKYVVRIKKPSGEYTKYANINATVKIQKAGEYYLEVQNENTSQYEGFINISAPKYIVRAGRIHFGGKIVNYDIPKPFVHEWFGGRQIVCDIEDTGFFDTSKYHCIIEFPISMKIDELSFPTTLEDKQASDQLINQTIEGLKDDVSKRSILVSFMGGVAILSLLLTAWFIGFAPYFRWRYG